MIEKDVYTFKKIQQMIPLTDGILNFTLRLSITTKNSKPFEYLIVTEEELNDMTKLDFKLEKDGFLEAEITSNDNVQRNYVLLIKSDDEGSEFTVEKDVQEVSPETELVYDPKQNQQLVKKTNEKPEQKSYMIWYVVGIILLMIIGYFLLTCRDYDSQEFEIPTKPLPVTQTIQENNSGDSYIPYTTPPVSSDNNSGGVNSKSFIDRLNEIDL